MKTSRTLFLLCPLIALMAAPVAMAGSRGQHAGAGPGTSRASARPMGRVSNGMARSWNGANVSRNFRSFGRNTVPWNGQQIRRTGYVNRATGAHWSGNGQGHWNGNGNHWHGNGNGWHGYGNCHWNHHHYCGNRVVYVGGFGYGYPWYYPYSYYPYSYSGSCYPYGAYPAAYSDYSNVSYGEPVYDGNSSYNYNGNQSGYQATADANGSVVAEVQRFLTREGFYQGPIDGVLGSRTYYAVRAYQRSRNLTADGQIGPEVRNAMGLN
jgi:hypothetical protein